MLGMQTLYFVCKQELEAISIKSLFFQVASINGYDKKTVDKLSELKEWYNANNKEKKTNTHIQLI